MLMLPMSPLQPKPSFPYRAVSPHVALGSFFLHKKQVPFCCSSHTVEHGSEQNGLVARCEENVGRRLILFLLVLPGFPVLASHGKMKGKNPYDERRLLEQNKWMQKENNAPEDFPNFIREGFQVKVVASENYVKRDSGLIYRDFEVGEGDCPKAGQQVTFHYIGYNESGRRIDSTYLQGSPARIRMGTNALVPGFEEGIRDMRPGGKRRIIIPPELGPPFLLLGAVPFPADVPHLKELGVGGVVTLNEPYETLVPTNVYHAHNINHLVIPTRDYLFAPSYGDISKAVDFIHENESCGKTTYVHCKAGRGRSTTIVLCYLVEHKEMTPDAAYEYVRSIRPRVLSASSQWQAVQNYYRIKLKKAGSCAHTTTPSKSLRLLSLGKGEVTVFDDGSMVMVTDSDLDGYDGSKDSNLVGNKMVAELSLACRVQFASQAAMARL